ncbi:MAG: bifunctional precorrin-2 dehydrogenase/sirohydrochlorin ferrochelatase [Candidatus Omnitrophica bacterium]|nr:bifunctional precorrin-2 dehydrogenase/sirohydrochlorin ferrochelatase [Candidatus Omnitrophota bacterium]
MIEKSFRQKRPMRFLPLAIDVKDKPVVVIGGGKVAFQKLKTIILFGAHVTVISKRIIPEIKALSVHFLESSYDKKFLKQASLVYACTSDKRINRAISHDAKKLGILCNTADDIDACSFISPAVMVEEDLVVSINSQGRAPARAKLARDFIKEKIHEFVQGARSS